MKDWIQRLCPWRICRSPRIFPAFGASTSSASWAAVRWGSSTLPARTGLAAGLLSSLSRVVRLPVSGNDGAAPRGGGGAHVRHPQVVTLYGFGEAAPWSYLALEFVPGGTLKSRLSGPLPAKDAARLVEMVARAVHKIHQDGFYHLDLKPSNILLEDDENTLWNEVTPKVTDFSIARFADDAMASLSAGMPFGTPAYMSPEQSGRSGRQIGPATDVYALGAILYELLTGRPPIQRTSIGEALEAVCKQEPISPRRLNPAICATWKRFA